MTSAKKTKPTLINHHRKGDVKNVQVSSPRGVREEGKRGKEEITSDWPVRPPLKEAIEEQCNDKRGLIKGGHLPTQSGDISGKLFLKGGGKLEPGGSFELEVRSRENL